MEVPSTPTSQAAGTLRLRQTTGCHRQYLGIGHRQCCSICRGSLGQLHTRRCNRTQRAQGDTGQTRFRVTQCSTAGCQRISGVGHHTCCSRCGRSRGAYHTKRCQQMTGATAGHAVHNPAGRSGDGSAHGEATARTAAEGTTRTTSPALPLAYPAYPASTQSHYQGRAPVLAPNSVQAVPFGGSDSSASNAMSMIEETVGENMITTRSFPHALGEGLDSMD